MTREDGGSQTHSAHNPLAQLLTHATHHGVLKTTSSKPGVLKNTNTSSNPSNSNDDSTFPDFLVEHAKFPFPDCPIGAPASSTGLSELDVGHLDDQWKPRHAVRDNDLAKKLCDALKATLGEMPVTEHSRNSLLRWFLPTLFVDEDGMEEGDWSNNPSEAHVSY